MGACSWGLNQDFQDFEDLRERLRFSSRGFCSKAMLRVYSSTGYLS